MPETKKMKERELLSLNSDLDTPDDLERFEDEAKEKAKAKDEPSSKVDGPAGEPA